MKKPRKKAKINKTELSPENFAYAIRYGIKHFIKVSLHLQALKERFASDAQRLELLGKVRESIDDQFGVALRDYGTINHVAQTTDSSELFCNVMFTLLSTGEKLPEFLTRFEQQFAEPMDFA